MSANLNRSIGEVTEHMLLWRKETRQQLAVLLGLSVKSINRRISGEIPWEAWELKAMADHFGLPVDNFYDGPDSLFQMTAVETRKSITRRYPVRNVA